MKFLKLILAAFLLFIGAKTYGQTTFTNGCYVASQRAAYALTGTTCNKGFLDCSNSPTGNYIVITRMTTTACTSCSFGGVQRAGVLVDFAVFRCPLDDYIPLVILGIAGIGIVFIRRLKIDATSLDY